MSHSLPSPDPYTSQTLTAAEVDHLDRLRREHRKFQSINRDVSTGVWYALKQAPAHEHLLVSYTLDGLDEKLARVDPPPPPKLAKVGP